MSERCPWKIRWAFGIDAQCGKDTHILSVTILPEPGGKFSVESESLGDPAHSALLPGGVTAITWSPGDRREFQGGWPGPCLKLDYDPGSGARRGQMAHGCTLHAGHHGRCAPWRGIFQDALRVTFSTPQRELTEDFRMITEETFERWVPLEEKLTDEIVALVDEKLRETMTEAGEDPGSPAEFAIRRAQVGWSLNSRLSR